MALTIKTTGIEDYLDGGDTYVKALILGPPSAGKTRSASFWPKPIFADCEKGRMSIADRNVPYGEVLTTDDMATLLRMLKLECQKPIQSRRYQTFVVDTIDAYQRIVTQERLRSERKEALQGFADWGYLDAKMTQLISELLSLPMNIVVNAHTKENKDGDDGPLITGVKLKGDIKDQIAAEFDLVGLMGIHWEAVNGERVQSRSVEWHPRPTAPILKDRSGRLPRFTPVTFTEDDYTGLFIPLTNALDELKASQDVDVLAQDEDNAAALAVAPTAGGAVSAPVAPPAKKAPAKKAPAKAAPVPAAKKPGMEVVDANVPPATPPAPGTTTPVEGAAADQATGELPTEPAAPAEPEYVRGPGQPTDEQAVANAVEGLGGTVIEPEAPTTPVAEPEAPAPAPPAAAAAPAAGAAPKCGTAARKKDGSTDHEPVSGCGKDLATESKDVVNIGLIQTGRKDVPTYLCGACIAAFRAAA